MEHHIFSTVAFNLLGIIVFMLVFAFFAKKLKKIKQTSVQHLRLMGCIPVGQKERIAVIEFYNKQVLVGITAESIQTLAVHRLEKTDKLKEKETGNLFKQVMNSAMRVPR